MVQAKKTYKPLKDGFVRLPQGRQARILGKAHRLYIENKIMGEYSREEEIKKYEKILLKQKLRETRTVKTIKVKKIIQSLNIKLDESFYKNIRNNPIINDFHYNIQEIYNDAHKALYSDPNMLSANISMKYIAQRQVGKKNFYIKYTGQKPFRQELGDEYKSPPSPQGNSEFNFRFIGYVINFQTLNNRVRKKTIRDLKAYHPSSNRKFHEASSASTTQDNICIYETFLHNENILKLHKSKKHARELKRLFEEENENIRNAVTKGLLIESLELLTKKYNTETVIKCFNNLMNDIIVSNGKTTENPENKDLERFINKNVFHYEKNVHVAPIKYAIKKQTDKTKTKTMYRLKPDNLKRKPIKPDNILSFSINYILDSNDMKRVNSINLYGMINNKNIDEQFETVNEFIKKINEITTIINGSKTRSTKKVNNIFMFGHDNSKDDNIFIYKELYKNDPSTKYCFSGNTIKYMKYRNMFIYDLKLFYNSDIDQVYKDFGFYTDKNIKKHEMIYFTADKHLELSSGKINGKYFNFVQCSTVSGLAKKSITQTFLKCQIIGSPEEIQKIERLSLFGGKNEIFKKKFSDDKKHLYVYDINSAHPYNMRGLMPYQFQSHFKGIGFKEMKKFVNYFLYYVRATHKQEKHFIPNLLTRKGQAVNALNNCEGWFWGSELNEAIKNKYKIEVNELITYEAKELFNGFVDFYSNKKIESKKTGNKAEYKYCKNILNNVIGKFSQKDYTVSSVVKDYDEMISVLGGDIANSLNSKEIDDFMIVEYKNDKESFNTIGSLCRLSSYITAGTRNQLSEMMRKIGHEHIYYCATDSIFTDKKINKKHIDQYELGKWNLEKVCDRAYFIGCGSYFVNDIKTGNHNKCKAFNKKDVIMEDYERLVNNNDLEIIKQFTINKRDLNNVKIEKQNRNLRTHYNKRIFDNNDSIAYNDWL